MKKIGIKKTQKDQHFRYFLRMYASSIHMNIIVCVLFISEYFNTTYILESIKSGMRIYKGVFFLLCFCNIFLTLA